MNQVYAELLPWLQQQPVWQNEAFRRLLKQVKLTDQDLAEVYQIAGAELGVGPAVPVMPQKVSAADIPAIQAAQVQQGRLKALHSCENVNMLVKGARLEFGPNLTLVYGDNAVGKSGYARVMKGACRCHASAVEKILTNLYQVGGGAVTATFDLHLDGIDHAVGWQAAAGAHPSLQKFAVFDSKAARNYLSEKNNIPVVPRVFLQLEELGVVVKTIKDRLFAAAAARRPEANALAGFVGPTQFGLKLAGISAATSIKDLEAQLVWSDSDAATLTDGEKQAAVLKANGPQALQAVLQQRRKRLETLRQVLQTAEGRVGVEALAEIAIGVATRTQLEQQRTAAAELAQGRSKIGGIRSEAWEAMLAAAFKFFGELTPGVPFPGPAGDRCVLCQQEMGEEARERLTAFWDYLQSDVSTKLAAENAKLAQLVKNLAQAPGAIPPEVKVSAELLAAEVPALWAKVGPQFELVNQIKEAVQKAAETGDWSQVVPLKDSLVAACSAAIEQVFQDEQNLADPAKAAAELIRLEGEVANLQCREKAVKSREVILAYARRLREAAALQAASDDITTLATSNKTSALQKTHVLEAFANRVKEEATALGMKRAVPLLTPKTTAGKVTHSVGIAGAKLAARTDEVFSEGERTALALAYFLAEIGTTGDTFGVILDDPVTSMDHRIRTKVVDRIVKLAAERQVIILTHDLPFYCELREAAIVAHQAPEICSVEALGTSIGQVRKGEPFAAMSLNARLPLLVEQWTLAKAAEKAGDLPGFREAVLRFYSLLRSTWERCVEELLFNKVVLRWDKRVKTMSLTSVVVDAAAITTIFGGMTRASNFIEAHDHAEAAGDEWPASDELKTEHDELAQFIGEHRKRMKQQEKDLEHLKGKN